MHGPAIRLLLALSIFVLAGAAPAPAVPAGAAGEAGDYLSKLPPLIDRELFFGDPEISGAQISGDGRFISFRKPYRGVMNVWIKKTNKPFGSARPLTADTERPVRAYFWTQDSRYVLYLQDQGGNENFHIHAVDPTAKPGKEAKVPPARDLTPIEGITARIYALPERTPDTIVIGLNDRDPAVHDVYRLTISTGERELLLRNEQNVVSWVADLDGNIRLAYRTTADGGGEVLRVGDDGLEPVYSCTFEETCAPARFHKDGKRVYMVTNTGDHDLSRLVLFDPATGEEQLVHQDPEGEVDFGSPIFSDATEQLIGAAYVGDRVRIYPFTDQLKRDLAVLRDKLPDGELGFSSATEDDRYALVGVASDVNPGSVYLYDSQQGSVEKLYDSRPELPSEHMAPVTPVRYTARDGQEIPAYLTVPRGVEPRRLPAIVVPHGGPWSRDRWGFSSVEQFLANRGYVVLSPNFRGSTGYGKAFLNAGNGEWGTGLMQHDISDGVKYLVDEGIADPERIAIMGGSYGGYATLAGLTFTPDLYAAGVSIVGPSNIITLLKSIPAYWGPIQKIFHRRVGDPDDPADQERLKRQSPLYSATRINKPLLVIQGANDPRVKQAESDQIVVALRDLGRPVEYMVAPDEGHGFAGRENRLAMHVAIERFLAQHLGGRHQQSMQKDVATRLEALMVDVASVKMPELPEGLELAKTSDLPPVSAETLKPLDLRYTSKVQVGAQELIIRSTRTHGADTLDDRPVWKVTGRAETPAGNAEDTFWLDPATLQPLRRSASQGPARIELQFTAERVTGRIQAGPSEVDVDRALEAPVFGEGPGLEAVLLALPLEPGYHTNVRVFETARQQVRPMSVTVAGKETLDVAAGSFETWHAVLQPLDGESGGGDYWVSTGSGPMLIRSVTRIPPVMGGGKVSTELTEVVDAN